MLSGPPGGGSDGRGSTPLHWVAEMSDAFDPITNDNQVRCATILLDAGANINAPAEHLLGHVTPLHRAMHSAIYTNLQLIQLFMDRGADPNALDSDRDTPMMHTLGAAAPAALYVLEHYPDKVQTDIVNQRGWTLLHMVRNCIRECTVKLNWGSPPAARQLLERNLAAQKALEEALVQRGAKE